MGARKDVWDGGTGRSTLEKCAPPWWRGLRTAQVLACVIWAVNANPVLQGFGGVWGDLGMSCSSSGRGSTHPVGGEDVPAGISFPHRIPSLPTLLLPRYLPGAASLPLHPESFPFRGAQQGGINPMTHTEIPHPVPTAAQCTGGPSQEKKTAWEKAKEREEEQLDLFC